TVMVGATNANTNIGVAYVFERSGMIWSLRAELGAPDGSWGDCFGCSLAVSGTTAVFGAPGASNKGAAYVFVHAGQSWSSRAKVKAPDPQPYDFFGYSVATSGSTVLVGASDTNNGA